MKAKLQDESQQFLKRVYISWKLRKEKERAQKREDEYWAEKAAKKLKSSKKHKKNQPKYDGF